MMDAKGSHAKAHDLFHCQPYGRLIINNQPKNIAMKMLPTFSMNSKQIARRQQITLTGLKRFSKSGIKTDHLQM